MGRRKGQTFEARALDRKFILKGISRCKCLRDKALIATIFLLEARKSEVLEIRKDMIHREDDFLIFDVPIKKRKKKLIRKIPVPLDDPFTKYIVEYLKHCKGKLFDLTPQRVWQITKSLGFSPHELRHSRLTEIASFLPSDIDLYRVAGWKLPGMAEVYVHLRYKHLKPCLKEVALRAKKELGGEEYEV